MGWDYYTYENQPLFFIEEILIIMGQEAQKTNRDSKQLGSKAKRAGRK